MLIYVACWPLLAYLAGNLIPAIGSGDLSKVSTIIVKSLFVFLVQKTAQFGQDVFIAKPSLEISEVMRGNLFSRIQKIKMNSVKRKDGTKEKQPELTASKIHQISPVEVIKSDQKENNELFENKESSKKSSWDSSPLVPEVDEIPF